jgi:hypothetical protein
MEAVVTDAAQMSTRAAAPDLAAGPLPMAAGSSMFHSQTTSTDVDGGDLQQRPGSLCPTSEAVHDKVFQQCRMLAGTLAYCVLGGRPTAGIVQPGGLIVLWLCVYVCVHPMLTHFFYRGRHPAKTSTAARGILSTTQMMPVFAG